MANVEQIPLPKICITNITSNKFTFHHSLSSFSLKLSFVVGKCFKCNYLALPKMLGVLSMTVLLQKLIEHNV